MPDFGLARMQLSSRRSLLATFAGVAAALTVSRRSDGAEIVDRRSNTVPPSGESTERRSGNPVAASIDLKTLGPEHQVASIVPSATGYRVMTVSGKAISFAEFDLRFKTDSSARGPTSGRPVLLPASMRTDRAFVVFASIREISAFVDQPA